MNYHDEAPHVRRLLALRPEAKKGRFPAALRTYFIERYVDSRDECEEWLEFVGRFTRLPDAYEFTASGLILYEVDCTHRTKLNKLRDIVLLADALYGTLPLGLAVYDVTSDSTRWWNAHALSSLYVSAIGWGDREDLAEDAPIPANLPCSLRLPGLQPGLMRWDNAFTYYGPDVVVTPALVTQRDLVIPDGVVRYGETLDLGVMRAIHDTIGGQFP